MASVNKVILIGNLTRDPEVRYTPKGTPCTNFSLAVNRKYKVENEVREEVTFVGVVFWGKAGQTIAEYVKKGDPLYVEGRLSQDSWSDRDSGEKRTKTYVVGEEFQFLKGRGNREEGRGGEGGVSGEYGAGGNGGSGGKGGKHENTLRGAPVTGPEEPKGLDEEEEIPF